MIETKQKIEPQPSKLVPQDSYREFPQDQNKQPSTLNMVPQNSYRRFP